MIPNFISNSLKIRNVTSENQAENFYRSIISFGKYKHPTENIIIFLKFKMNILLDFFGRIFLTALLGDGLSVDSAIF